MAPIATHTDRTKGWVKGEPKRFIRHHHGRVHLVDPGPNPSGLCLCGCGTETPLASETDRKKGMVKGRPRRYVHGHNSLTSGSGNKDNWTVDPESGCWLWQGATMRGGYGVLRIGGRAGRTVNAHRHVFERERGPIAPGLEAHHSCGVPACVSPDHIDLLTPAAHREAHRAAA